MKIVFCAAEAAPYVKVGGLGDVVGSLPKALVNVDPNVEVLVMLPQYGSLLDPSLELLDSGVSFQVEYHGQSYPFRVLEKTLPGSRVPIYFFANHELFGQYPGPYPGLHPTHEALRFEVFAQAVYAFLTHQHWDVDILHLHDWHTAPLAVFLKDHYQKHPLFQGTRTVLSIHNLAYQGNTGYHDWLAEGLEASDALVAVSPTYAHEILTPEGGANLEHIVQRQQHKLCGILNGIDTDLFNPATDVFLPARYDASTVQTGKATCKEALQMHMGLPVQPDVPLIGMVSRLAEQKGLDLILEAMPQLQALDAQFVFLGSGEPVYQDGLRQWNETSPNIRTMVGFNMALGQHIYAGADAFLMPSRFEPCGLSQMIALRYGTVPIVRQTGGLADTVFDSNNSSEKANGFCFRDYTPEAMIATVRRALATYTQNPSLWESLIQRGMTTDFSWAKSAQAYLNIYAYVKNKATLRTL